MNGTIYSKIYCKRCVLFFFLCIGSLFVQGQSKHISGFVYDQETGESLVGATVLLGDGYKGCITNRYGHFNVVVNSERIKLQCSYIGYRSSIQEFSSTSDTTVVIRLQPATFAYDEIAVIGNRVQSIEKERPSVHRISQLEMKRTPSVLGESDALKTLQLLPGVQSGMEGSSALIVRGGSPDQNLILIDGVPVYNASHLLGMFSVFPPEAIKQVDFYKGAFPARYGGRLSSVVDVSMKEGNNQKFTGEYSIGTLSSKALIEGPIVKDKGSFMISARRTYLDALAAPIIKFAQTDDEKNSYKANFYDLTAKANYSLNSTNHIYLSYYQGRDKGEVGFDQFVNEVNEKHQNSFNQNLTWGNKTMALRWHTIHSPSVNSNFSVNYGRFNYGTSWNYKNQTNTPDESLTFDHSESRFSSWVENVALKTETNFDLHSNLRLSVGFEGGKEYFRPGKRTTFSVTNGVEKNEIKASRDIDANNLNGFGEIDWKVTSFFSVNVGMRASLYETEGTRFTSYQPRLVGRLDLSKRLKLMGSYSEMFQPIHLLGSGVAGLPTDLWLPATPLIQPETSKQFSAGLFYTTENGWDLSAEVYQKTMTNQIDFRTGETIESILDNWEQKVTVGEGRASGFELLVKKKGNKSSGWIGYAYGKNERRFDALNKGQWFDYRYDRRHDVKANWSYTFSKRCSFSANYVWSTGYPFSLPTQQYIGYPNLASNETWNPLRTTPYTGQHDLSDFGVKNGARMENYHRLDVAVRFSKEKRKGIRTWTFGLYNAYNQMNAFNYNIKYNEENDELRLKKVVVFPVLPSVTWSYKFY